MENVILIIHLILALALIGVVLLQRSEGGGLGMGGGGAMGGRAPASPLGKVTWGLGGAFVITSIALTIIAAENSAGSSVLDRLGDAPVVEETEEAPAATIPGAGDSLLPPSAGDTAPLVPRAE